jgi:hypothetical protein
MSHKINRPVPATVLSRRARARIVPGKFVTRSSRSVYCLLVTGENEHGRRTDRRPALRSHAAGWLAAPSTAGDLRRKHRIRRSSSPPINRSKPTAENQERAEHRGRRTQDRELTGWMRGEAPARDEYPGDGSSFLAPRFAQGERRRRSFWFGLARKEEGEEMGERKRKVRVADLFRGWAQRSARRSRSRRYVAAPSEKWSCSWLIFG